MLKAHKIDFLPDYLFKELEKESVVPKGLCRTLPLLIAIHYSRG